MDFGLSLINCSKTAPFLTTQWVSDHEGSTVGVGVGQSNDSSHTKNKTQTSELNAGLSFFYLIRRIIYIMLFFYLLDKWCELVYTNSVVNREVIRYVVDIL